MFELLFYQPISSRFVRRLTKMVEAEGSFEERLNSETVQQSLLFMIMVRFH